MKVKLKIIEFSSDVFSRSSQLKDIHLSPLFSNIDFNINMFEAISKNEEYEIKTNFQIIKIGLYQGKSLLGVGEVDINKKSQKIKIASQKNNIQNFFPNNSSFNQIQDNDYYISLECSYNIKEKEKLKNSHLKENKLKKQKNASVDNKSSQRYYNKIKKNKPKLDSSIKEYFNGDINKQTKKNYKLKDDFKIAIYNKEKINSSFQKENLQSNSYILKKEKNEIVKDILDSNNKDKSKDKDIDDSNSKEFIFNDSFQKEKFSDGVLNLNNNAKNEEEDIENIENIEISNFNNIISDFNLIYNNVNNNNSKSLSNINDNFKLEYQYFLEKTSDIFNLYYTVSSKMNIQNIDLKNKIRNISNRIKCLYKKNAILKVKSQNVEVNDLNDNYKHEANNKNNTEIKNINNKLSLVKNINNDILLLINNSKYNKKSEIKRIFEEIINKDKNYNFLKNDEKFIKYLIINTQNINSNQGNGNNNKYIPKSENKVQQKKDEKVDIDKLKNKIDKLKNQYINESITKENKNKYNKDANKKKKFNPQNKINSQFSNNKSAKNIHNIKKNKYYNNSSSITDIFDEYKSNKYKNYYYNAFTPNSNKRSQMIKSDF